MHDLLLYLHYYTDGQSGSHELLNMLEMVQDRELVKLVTKSISKHSYFVNTMV